MSELRCVGCDQGTAEGVALRRVNRLGVRGIWACPDCLPQIWRCFHCDEVFLDANKAAEHFGRAPIADPACLIDIAKFREMEEFAARCRAEDSDTDRRMYAMRSEHDSALRRASVTCNLLCAAFRRATAAIGRKSGPRAGNEDRGSHIRA